MVAIAPVTIRNAALGGEFVLISTNGGINFFIGNNAHADETVAIRPGEHWKRLAREAIDSGARTHAGKSRLFFDRAPDWAREHPLDFLAGLGRKAIRVISAREIPRNVDVYVHREDSALLSLLVWRVGSVGFPMALLTPLAVVGMCIGRPKTYESGTDAPGNGAVLSRRLLMSFVLLYSGVGGAVLRRRPLSASRRGCDDHVLGGRTVRVGPHVRSPSRAGGGIVQMHALAVRFAYRGESPRVLPFRLR